MSIDSRLLRHDTLLIELGRGFKIMTETRIQFNLATTPAPVTSPPLYCCNNKVHFIMPFYVRAINAFPPANSLGRRPFTLLQPPFEKNLTAGPSICLATDRQNSVLNVF